jgi:hypothetical protein
VHLEQFAALDKVAERHRLDAKRLRLAAAAGSIPIALELDELWQPGDSLGLIASQPLV